MTSTASHSDGKLSTFRSLARLLPFAKPVLGRLSLGALSALIASLLALAIPLVLEEVVRGPMASGDLNQISWGAVAILVLGLFEAVMVWARRWFVLAPATKVEYELRTVPKRDDPADDILDAVEHDDVILVVLGIRRRTPIGKILLGSTSQRVAIESPVPVVLVKPEDFVAPTRF